MRVQVRCVCVCVCVCVQAACVTTWGKVSRSEVASTRSEVASRPVRRLTGSVAGAMLQGRCRRAG